jgi:uncharacterized protein (DUF305 family)
LNPYIMLAAMAVAMFIAMFGLMYAMVDQWSSVFGNINQVYMTVLMTAAMILIELAIMRHMYPSRSANLAIVAVSIVALAASWFGIRQQWAVNDDQFLRSMIPHHGAAVLMCEEAPVERAEIKTLCEGILLSQRAEIAQMKMLLEKRQ